MKRIGIALLLGLTLLTGCAPTPETTSTRGGATQPEQVVVPDITGLPANEALQALTAVDLDLRAIDDEEDRIVGRLRKWQVISQTPEPGTTVDAGSMIDGRVKPNQDDPSQRDAVRP